MNTSKFLLSVLLMIPPVIIQASSEAQSQPADRYVLARNSRFGFQLMLPRGMFSARRESDNGDGFTIGDPQSFHLVAYASFNIDESRPYRVACFTVCSNEHYWIDRRDLGISEGTRGAFSYSNRCVLRDDTMHCLLISYPTHMTAFRAIAERASSSFSVAYRGIWRRH